MAEEKSFFHQEKKREIKQGEPGEGIEMPPGEHPLANTDFITEKIKERPVNYKSLMRRTIITMLMAVMFGGVACATFLLLEPFFNSKINPGPEPRAVTFPKEEEGKEIAPEDLFADDKEIVKSEKEEMIRALRSYQFNAGDFEEMMQSVRLVAEKAKRSMVTVTGTVSGTDFINEQFESSGSQAGAIIADNGTQTLILCDESAVKKAKDIHVTLPGGTVVDARIKSRNPATGLCILAVDNEEIPVPVKQTMPSLRLGSSYGSSLTGSFVIAVGAPTGAEASVVYGEITSQTRGMNLTDLDSNYLTTNMPPSPAGSGVLIDLKGEIVGLITPTFSAKDSDQTCLSAAAISPLKDTIEKLSNHSPQAYLGVHGADVPDYIRAQEGIPQGAYIAGVEVGSPAMKAGLQSGDVITSFGKAQTLNCSALVLALSKARPEEKVRITLMRESKGSYIETSRTLTLGDVSQMDLQDRDD